MAEQFNRDWGKIVKKQIEYAPINLIIDGQTYAPATETEYRAAGYKKIVRSVQPETELPERMKWNKTPAEDKTTIFYKWEQVQMSDAEYLVYCHNQLNESDWATTAYMEGELSETEWAEWKAKRKVWRDFIRGVES